jgi:hypothetical protein
MVNMPRNGGRDGAKVMLFDLKHEGRDKRATTESNVVPTRSVSQFCSHNKTYDTSIVTLPDPSSREERQYIFVTNTATSEHGDIFEVQSLCRSGFGSFFVGSRVVSDGALHVSSRIDPLFFVLSTVSAHQENDTKGITEQAGKAKWQPYDQLMAVIPDAVQKALPKGQHRHLMETTDKFGDDMLVAKFSEDRAIQWLKEKYSRATKAVTLQMVHSKQKKIAAKKDEVAKGGGGAFSASFSLPQSEITGPTHQSNSDTGSESSLTKDEQREAREAGLQLVCEYLSVAWQTKLIAALEMSADDLLSTKQRIKKQQNLAGEQNEVGQKRKAVWDARPGQDEADKLLEYTMGAGENGSASDNNGTSKKLVTAQSFGLKKLAKVNTKGMKSISSFFGGGSKAKSKK